MTGNATAAAATTTTTTTTTSTTTTNSLLWLPKCEIISAVLLKIQDVRNVTLGGWLLTFRRVAVPSKRPERITRRHNVKYQKISVVSRQRSYTVTAKHATLSTKRHFLLANRLVVVILYLRLYFSYLLTDLDKILLRRFSHQHAEQI